MRGYIVPVLLPLQLYASRTMSSRPCPVGSNARAAKRRIFCYHCKYSPTSGTQFTPLSLDSGVKEVYAGGAQPWNKDLPSRNRTVGVSLRSNNNPYSTKLRIPAHRNTLHPPPRRCLTNLQEIPLEAGKNELSFRIPEPRIILKHHWALLREHKA